MKRYSKKALFSLAHFMLLILTICLPIHSRNNISKSEVVIEEIWRGFDWINNTRQTLEYDAFGNCTTELWEKWDKAKWVNYRMVKHFFDNLYHNTSSVTYSWNTKSANWELLEGTRSVIDTVNSKLNRTVLYNAQWDPVSKVWSASDSIIYDKKGRVIKTISRDRVIYGKDTLLVIETSENTYQSENNWVELSTTWRSDNKTTTSEQCRYRKISNIPLQYYAIDYWDKDANRWITNTGKLFRQMEGNRVVLDSLEEYINDKSVPVYVSAEIRDAKGNILQQRYWRKDIDESTNKWTGVYVKWDRSFKKDLNECTIAESVFVGDSSLNQWKLISYANKQSKVPNAGKIIETGDYITTLKQWEIERSFDTLTAHGILINGNQYFDEDKKQWISMLRFNTIGRSDSVSIVTEVLDLDKYEWTNDSLFILKLDNSGKVVSRVNHVWNKSGLFNANWEKTNRLTYLRSH